MSEEERYGPKVRWLRTGARLSGRELCRRVSVSPSYLSDIEGGRRLPAPETSDRIADELGTDRDGLWRLAVLERLSDRDLAALTPLAPEVPPEPDAALRRLRHLALNATRDRQGRQDWLAEGPKAAFAIAAPEVPPREDGLREAVEAQITGLLSINAPLSPIERGNLGAYQDVLNLIDRLAATRTPEPPDSGDGAGIDAALLAEALPDALSAMTEGDDETPAPQPSDEPGSPYVVGLARALAARLRSGSPAPEGGE